MEYSGEKSKLEIKLPASEMKLFAPCSIADLIKRDISYPQQQESKSAMAQTSVSTTFAA